MTSLLTQSQPLQQQGRSSIRRKTSQNGNLNNHHHHHSNKGSSSSSSVWMGRSSRLTTNTTATTTTATTSNKKRIPQCIVFGCITILCFQFITLIPIFLYETQQETKIQQSSSSSSLLLLLQQQQQQQQQPQLKKSLSQYTTRRTKDQRSIPEFTMSDLVTIYNEPIVTTSLPLLRGIQNDIYLTSTTSSSSSNNNIPDALIGAQHGQIICPTLNVNSLAYWNDPIGTRDIQYHSPFSVYTTTTSTTGTTNNNNKNNKNEFEMYISFAPDPGGWNNIRMSMEIIFVLAAATKRTLILPPKEPLYLLHHDNKQKHRGFADFFPIHTLAFQSIVKTITFEEFVIKEGKDGPLSVKALLEQQQQQQSLKFGNDTTTNPDNIPIPTYEQLLSTADHCDKRKISTTNCMYVYNYLRLIGHTPDISASDTCLIFDEMIYHNANTELPISIQDYISLVCGEKRQQVYFNAQETRQHRVLHFQADQPKYRLLTHFYNMIHFTNPIQDHYYKRFVRNFLHYHDSIYCAAGKIVKALQLESALREPSYVPDVYGAGGYSALHVRRGDLQYKKVKISAAEWYNNTKEIWKPKELLYIATDEKDKSFFNDLAKHHTLRFLDDYWDMAGLSELDPNYMGMIDTIVASRGRAFAGTWFSTFSGYINRLRGYHGMSMQDSWYSFLDKKTAVHEWHIVDDFVYAYEFPDGWIGIDTDTFPTRDKF